jgi:formiminotetrahydrofolate cyclodeaminase
LAALYNVKINLSSIKDEDFVNALTREVKDLEMQARDKEKELLSYVEV